MTSLQSTLVTACCRPDRMPLGHISSVFLAHLLATCLCRSEALQVVLDAASGTHADTRNKAVRLIANKLFAQPQLQGSIAAFARQMLFKLIATAPTSTSPPATAGAPSATVLSAEPGIAPPQQQVPTPAATPSDPPSALPQPSVSSSQQELQLQSEEDGTRFAGLYCALCTKQQTLLRELLLVYGQAAEGVKAAIEAVATGNAQSVGIAPLLRWPGMFQGGLCGVLIVLRLHLAVIQGSQF